MSQALCVESEFGLNLRRSSVPVRIAQKIERRIYSPMVQYSHVCFLVKYVSNTAMTTSVYGFSVRMVNKGP